MTDTVKTLRYLQISGQEKYVIGQGGVPTSVCTALSEVRNGNTVTLKWNDPNDTFIDGQKICTWSHTVIVRKQGSYPKNELDGDVIVKNTMKGFYANTGFVDTVPTTIGDKYYYRAFPISANGVANYDPLNKFGIEMYEFTINPSDSNPTTCVAYSGTNASYTPAYMDYSSGNFNYGSWANAFFMKLFKPCMVKSNGTVDYYLNPNDYTKQEDGSTDSDVANTSYDGNAMVEIGQIWVSEQIKDGKYYIRIANGKVDDSFDCYTHLKADRTCRKNIYRALFDGALLNGKIRSISGLSACCNQSGNNQINYAKANGAGWDIDEYSLRRVINYLLVLISKSLDTQTKFGQGVTSGGEGGKVVSGTLNNKGMFWGSNGTTSAVKVFHMENLWGNLWKIVNGLLLVNGKEKFKLTSDSKLDGSNTNNYNLTGDGYIDSGVTPSGTSGGYISKMTLVPKLGLCPTVMSGSQSTYYCDAMWYNNSGTYFARFGGSSGNGAGCGAFYCVLSFAVGDSYWSYGVSLSYKSAS